MRWIQFKHVMTTHQHLVKELVMLLLCGVVCFLYFNEQWLAHGQAERRQTLRNLADQLAEESYVPFAADNRVSLNVLVSRLASRQPVVAVAVENLDKLVLSSAGKPLGDTIRVTSAIGDKEQIIGRVVVHGKAVDNLSTTAFVILMLLLVGVRVALYMLWAKLVPLTDKVRNWRNVLPRGKGPESAATVMPQLPLGDVLLTLTVTNHDTLTARLTPGALQDAMAPYQIALDNVVSVYGMTSQPLAKRLTFRLPYVDETESLFLLTCAAALFNLCCKKISAERRAAGDVCLSFGVLISVDQAPDVTEPGAEFVLLLSALDPHLVGRLDYQLLQQWQENGQEWFLLAVERLVGRYVKLIEAQSRSVLEQV